MKTGLILEGGVFVLRPQNPLAIGRMEKDPEKVQMVYDQGRTETLAQLENLKNWFA